MRKVYQMNKLLILYANFFLISSLITACEKHVYCENASYVYIEDFSNVFDKNIYNIKQENNESMESFLERFKKNKQAQFEKSHWTDGKVHEVEHIKFGENIMKLMLLGSPLHLL